MARWMVQQVRYWWIAILFSSLPLLALAYSGGITQRTAPNAGCGTCHGSSPGATQITAQSGSGSWTVQTGQTLQITLIVAHSSRPRAGINIAVKTTQGGNQDAGNLQPIAGSGLKKVGNELTHQAPKNLSGGQVTFQCTWQAPSTPGTYYLQVAANAVNGNGRPDSGDEWKVMSPIAITVTAPAQNITVTQPNGGEQWCRGTLQQIEWDASNINTVDIVLSTDGGNSYTTVLAENLDASQGMWEWHIPADFAQSTQCRIRVQKHQDSSVADESDGNFAVYQETRILSQSQSQEVCEGEQLILSVEAEGGSLEYQWRKDGQPIPGATEAQLLFASVQLADSGMYDVIVTGWCGPPVVSEPIQLRVISPPRILRHPVPQTVCEGDTVRLSVRAEGKGLSYQWYKNGALLVGATDSVLVLHNVVDTNAGVYQVIVSGQCAPAAVSDPAMVTVLFPPSIVQHPQDTTVLEGATVTLVVQAQGDSVAYQWRKDGQPIPGATDPVLILQSVQLADSGRYDCQVSNQCGIVISEAAQLRVEPAGPGPMIGLSHTLLDFDTTVVGSTVERELVVTNTGTEELSVSSVTIAGAASMWFQVQAPGSGFTLQPNESRSITIRYEPQQRGEHRAELQFVSNAKNSPVVQLWGFAGIYVAQLSVYTLHFGNVGVGIARDTTVVLANFGDLPLTVTKLTLHDDPEGVFSILEPSPPFLLTPGASTGILLRFQPTAARSYGAKLRVRFAEDLDPLELMLSGNGVVTSVPERSDTVIVTPTGLAIWSSRIVRSLELWDLQGRHVGKEVLDRRGRIWIPWEQFVQLPQQGVLILRIRFADGTASARVIVRW